MSTKGRPRKRPLPTDPGIAERICESLIAGNSITKTCEPPDMPSVHDVYVEMARNESFRNDIARARELQQEAVIDSTVDMADAATVEDVNVVKLRIWARQWRAAKLAPKKYGERIVQELTGKDGGPIEQRVTTGVDWSKYDRDELKALEALLEKGKPEPKSE